jgi:hypothetical protein
MLVADDIWGDDRVFDICYKLPERPVQFIRFRAQCEGVDIK